MPRSTTKFFNRSFPMEIVWNRYKNEQCYSNHRSDGDSFEQYVERMGASSLAPVKTEPVEAEAQRNLLRLLNLIPVYGIVVLPRNSRN